MISFSCSHCHLKMKIKPEFAGRKATCPTCKYPLVVPQLDRTDVHVPVGQIDGTASSVHQAGVEGGVTLRQMAGRKSVQELLGRTRNGQRYIIQNEIARGGMGAVVLALDCDIRREVAIKFMLDDKDAKKKLRFIEEAQITGQLEHPNIPPIHELAVILRGGCTSP